MVESNRSFLSKKINRRGFLEGISTIAKGAIGAAVSGSALHEAGILPQSEREIEAQLATLPRIPASVAETPPMGLNTWNIFGEDIDEEKCKEVMTAMNRSGLQRAGFIMFGADDGLAEGSRYRDGTYRTTSPNAIPNLASFAHRLGQTFMVYTSIGEATCTGRIGSFGHMEQDVQYLLVSDVDGIKADTCYTRGAHPVGGYIDLRKALIKFDRIKKNILVEVCNRGENKTPHEWPWSIGSYNRTTEDISGSFESVTQNFVQSIDAVGDMSLGHYNHMDNTEVGNGTLTFEEEKAHFIVWSFMNNPLILGLDPRGLTADSDVYKLITNRELILLNKDLTSLHAIGNTIKVQPLSNDTYHIQKPVKGGGMAHTLFNPTNKAVRMEIPYEKSKWNGELVVVRDLFQKQDVAVTKNTFDVTIPPHGADVFAFRPISGMNHWEEAA